MGGQCRKNGVNDTIHITIHLVVPETQDLKSGISKMPIADAISRFACFHPMLGSIDFDNQHVPKLGKVDDVAIEGSLSSEVMPLPIEMFQLNPQFDLLRGHGFA